MVVCPAGFVSDHLEILYDLDVACRSLAGEVGLPWQRTRSPNADAAFCEALCDIVAARLAMSAR
jgi:ferrochelatase